MEAWRTDVLQECSLQWSVNSAQTLRRLRHAADVARNRQPATVTLLLDSVAGLSNDIESNVGQVLISHIL